jgi:hypothetical protein
VLKPDDLDVTEPNIHLPRCCVPGCEVVERGVGQDTCVAWGKRLCYGPHFDAFAASELSWTCSDRGKGPTEAEWQEFLSGLRAKERVA